MIYGSRLGLGVALALLVIACQEPQSNEKSQEEALQINRQWSKDATGDAPVLASGAYASLPTLDPQQIIFEKNRSFSDIAGQQYLVKIRCLYQKEPESIAFLAVSGPCKFEIVEDDLFNTELTISVFKNRKLLFDRIIPKGEFASIIDRRFLKNHVLTGADLFAYNEKYRQFIFQINIAQSIGGTEWYAQVYRVFDETGRIITSGLVDYPYHCDQMLELTRNDKYLITCSELLNLVDGSKRNFASGDVVLSRFLNDTSYAVVYDLQIDSVRCDTLVYFKNDTLIASDIKRIKNTVSPNAYIFHINGDTLATFRYHGFSNGSESYLTEMQVSQKMDVVAFFDRKRKQLQVFDLSSNMKRQLFKMEELNPWTASDTLPTLEIVEFAAQNQNQQPVRFFMNKQKRKLMVYSAPVVNR